MKDKIAVQLYSVRKEFEKDCEGTIRKLKEIGFNAVQVDGMRGNDPKVVAELLKKYDMKVIGLHIKHDRFFDDLDGIIEEAYLFDCKTIYDKYIEDEDQNEDGYRNTKKVLIDAAQKLSNLGFRVGLHNPEYDFNNEVDGRVVMDYITDPVNGISVYAEADTYWITVAGKDPVEFIKRYSGRTPIIHMKDIDTSLDLNDMDNNLREVGCGDVDFESIIRWGEKNGVEYYCIEQDSSKIGMFESLKIGLENLTKICDKLK
ncbi:sugar phosphate isomerase/epimerase family protein [Clostridium paraputrificum]|uniref:sugar phosphate isomerase/epimerase family protein n=1 Tax=Clostridium paraputrificum TaxID=29363 RepID=UPI003D341E3A